MPTAPPMTKATGRSPIRRSSQEANATLEEGGRGLGIERHAPGPRQQLRPHPLGLGRPRALLALLQRLGGDLVHAQADEAVDPLLVERARRVVRRAQPPDADELQPRARGGPALAAPSARSAGPARCARAPSGGCRTRPGSAAGGSGTPRPLSTSPCCRPMSARGSRVTASALQSASRSKARLTQVPSGALAAETIAAAAAATARRRSTRSQPGRVAPGGAEARAPADRREHQQAARHRQGGAPHRPLQDVAPRDVGQLVGHHHAHLVAREVAQEGVVEDDVPAAAEPRDVGVGGGRADAGVVDLHVVGAHPGAAREVEHLGRERRVAQRARSSGRAARSGSARAATSRPMKTATAAASPAHQSRGAPGDQHGRPGADQGGDDQLDRRDPWRGRCSSRSTLWVTRP